MSTRCHQSRLEEPPVESRLASVLKAGLARAPHPISAPAEAKLSRKESKSEIQLSDLSPDILPLIQNFLLAGEDACKNRLSWCAANLPMCSESDWKNAFSIVYGVSKDIQFSEDSAYLGQGPQRTGPITWKNAFINICKEMNYWSKTPYRFTEMNAPAYTTYGMNIPIRYTCKVVRKFRHKYYLHGLNSNSIRVLDNALMSCKPPWDAGGLSPLKEDRPYKAALLRMLGAKNPPRETNTTYLSPISGELLDNYKMDYLLDDKVRKRDLEETKKLMAAGAVGYSWVNALIKEGEVDKWTYGLPASISKLVLNSVWPEDPSETSTPHPSIPGLVILQRGLFPGSYFIKDRRQCLDFALVLIEHCHVHYPWELDIVLLELEHLQIATFLDDFSRKPVPIHTFYPEWIPKAEAFIGHVEFWSRKEL